MNSDLSFLKKRFDGATSDSGIDRDRADAVFKQLLQAYREPQRHYHTLSHLVHMFKKQDQARLDDSACVWATWFHDAVYVPGKNNNEALSAEMATRHMTKLGLPTTLVNRTDDLIRLTQHHNCRDGDLTAHLFLDSDMSILGEKPSLYAQYVRGIRQEFSTVPRFLFNRGRKTFLKDLLNRDQIFLSNHFRDTYEASARRNLSEELQQLL